MSPALGCAYLGLTSDKPKSSIKISARSLIDVSTPEPMLMDSPTHPLLFNEVVKSVIRYHKHRKKIKDTRDEILANEFYYELEEMAKSKEEI